MNKIIAISLLTLIPTYAFAIGAQPSETAPTAPAASVVDPQELQNELETWKQLASQWETTAVQLDSQLKIDNQTIANLKAEIVKLSPAVAPPPPVKPKM